MLKKELNNLCRGCNGEFCCHGKAYMTTGEMKIIKKRTNLPFEKFVSIESINGEDYLMIKRKGNFCIFFDRNSQKCRIYPYRPIDCQLFPFTLEVINKKINVTFNKRCIKDKKIIDKKIVEGVIELIKKFPKKEMIKYALYNIHDQKNEEAQLKGISLEKRHQVNS